MGHHQIYQHNHQSFWRKGEKERAERIFKEIVAKNDPNLKKDVNPRSSMNTN